MGSQSVYILGNDHHEGRLSTVCDVGFVPEIYYYNYDQFKKSYSHVSISPEKDEILKELLERYKLKEHYNEFSTFMGYSNYLFSEYNEPVPNDPVFQDFERERMALSEYLEYLRKYLNNEIQNEIDFLQIHNHDGEGIKIKNFFVIDDVLRACCNSWNLTKENFDQRAQIMLDNTNDLIWKKAGEHIKVELLQSLYKYFRPKINGSENDTYRFIGLILHLSGISIIKNEEVELFESLEDNLEDCPIQNIRNYIKRPPKTLLS